MTDMSELWKIKKTREKTKGKQRNDAIDLCTSEDMENISLISQM